MYISQAHHNIEKAQRDSDRITFCGNWTFVIQLILTIIMMMKLAETEHMVIF